MSLLSWSSWLPSGFAQNPLGRTRRQRPPAKHQPGRRLRLESLEGLRLMSGLSLTAATVPALIADINAANTAGGSNTITLTAPSTSPYVLTAVNNSSVSGITGLNVNGLPVIATKDNLTIVGNGGTIERSTAVSTPLFRLLDVVSGGSLTLENLTLQGGHIPGSSGSEGTPSPAGPSLFAARGGAIYNQGTLVLNAVTVQNNVAGAQPGPIVRDAAGGGIFSYYGAVTLEGGTIVQNNTAEGSGATANAYGGGLAAIGGTVTVTNATLDNNTARAGEGVPFPTTAYAYAGGMYASGVTLNLTNATLDGNAATLTNVGEGVAGGGAYGGGLFLYGGTATLTSCIVQGNSASDSPVSSVTTGEGGGIYIYPGYPVATVYLDSFTVANTINNTDESGLNGSTANIDGTYLLQSP